MDKTVIEWRARCIVTKPNDERIELHCRLHDWLDDPEIQKRLTHELLREIELQGGPWGWTFGPLEITSHEIPAVSAMMRGSTSE